MIPQSGQLLLEWLAAESGEKVLDAGCGMGFLAGRLAAQGVQVTGVDRLGHLLEQARIAAPGAVFTEADLMSWSPGAPFDAILAHGLLNWLLPPREAAARLYAWLRPGGRLAAFLGAACAEARQLEDYYDPTPGEYAQLLAKTGFRVERWESAAGGFLVLARRP